MLAANLFDGDDYIEVPHDDTFELTNGTIALEFTANDVSGRKTLFSKDARGYGQGGHLGAFVKDGRVEVQLQSTNSTVTLRTEAGSVRAGEDYTLAITFGGRRISSLFRWGIGRVASRCCHGNQPEPAGASYWAPTPPTVI